MDVSGLSSLGAHVAVHEDALLDVAAPDEELRSALAARAGRRIGRVLPRRRYVVQAALAGGIGIACGLVASGLFFGTELFDDRAEPLSFTFDEPARPGNLGEWASAPANRELPIRFSDGSALSLKPDARGRVVSVASNGAEVVIESGHAFVSVVHRPGSNWKIRSGPFVVEVTGTRFELGWAPQRDELSVKVHEGSVRVSGCALESGHAVKGGQELRAACASGNLSVKPLAAEAHAPAVQQVTTGPAPPSAPPTATTARAAAPSWRELARQGHYARAYELARAAGFEAECRRGSSEDVLELADAARLAGKPADAHFAYTVVRRRFAGSDAAARAAFALGRAAFQSGEHASAAQWFRTYLGEQPSGSLASIALGRLLESQVKQGDHSGARDTAQRYINQFPAGPHADAARKVLGLESVPPQP